MIVETKEQLFDLIKNEASVGGLDGAYLASLLHHKHGSPLKKLGFTKLSHAIEEAERLGYVKRDKSVPHLRILPSESRPKSASQAKTQRFYIDKDFWHALFLNRDGDISVYDKNQRKVLHRPEAQEVSQHEILIEPIRADIQEKWLSEFIARERIDPEIPIKDLLPNADKLGQQDSKRWKYERTSRAVDELERWAEQNHVDPSVIFLPISSKTEVERQAMLHGNASRLRSSIMTAVSQMDESQLQKLSESIVICLYPDHADTQAK